MPCHACVRHFRLHSRWSNFSQSRWASSSSSLKGRVHEQDDALDRSLGCALRDGCCVVSVQELPSTWQARPGHACIRLYRLYREAAKKHALEEKSMAEKPRRCPRPPLLLPHRRPCRRSRAHPHMWAHPRTWARLRTRARLTLRSGQPGRPLWSSLPSTRRPALRSELSAMAGA